MVKLNTITKDIPATILAKIETTNPGNSIKDRMALKMIEDAEKNGLLKPGGTIIEGTSGNTGMGLAIAAVIKGYKCIFTSTDKQSKEKFDALRAFGAVVILFMGLDFNEGFSSRASRISLSVILPITMPFWVTGICDILSDLMVLIASITVFSQSIVMIS